MQPLILNITLSSDSVFGTIFHCDVISCKLAIVGHLCCPRQSAFLFTEVSKTYCYIHM